MTTNELASEKCIADDPPVPSPAELESDDLVTAAGEPPSTRLLLEGVRHTEITAEFLLGLHDLADEHGIYLDGISLRRPDPEDRSPERL